VPVTTTVHVTTTVAPTSAPTPAPPDDRGQPPKCPKHPKKGKDPPPACSSSTVPGD
jgi:hypothetical protein